MLRRTRIHLVCSSDEEGHSSLLRGEQKHRKELNAPYDSVDLNEISILEIENIRCKSILSKQIELV